ncbi:MAG: Transcriptional regulatory protein ZraR [Lentisphaerae bacterium ADurb.BinA184]|nr:MAG: Transcriptional regulatory protein ZraR [Lentisphaerae bacterium ADurb.BinA184]
MGTKDTRKPRPKARKAEATKRPPAGVAVARSPALVACPDPRVAETVAAILGQSFRVDRVGTRQAWLSHVKSRRYEVAFTDLRLLAESADGAGHPDFSDGLEEFWERAPETDLVVLTGEDTLREAVRAVRAGASDYLTIPVDAEQLSDCLANLQLQAQTAAELDYLRDEFWHRDAQEIIRTRCPRMREVLSEMQLAAPTKTTVLLTGETGTGKGVMAKIIHQHSNRKDAPFVSVHCGAIPDTLLESELFGYEKGAFTGAMQRRLGKFEIARGGTLFLDEIGTVSPAAQVKLLQAVQDHVVQRLGSDALVEVDVRVIAATNVDLKALCDRGLFRSDLYYRLSVFPIAIPPLRERLEDLPLLADSFLRKFNRQVGKNLRGVAPDVMKALAAYAWPGNVREMENLFERAFILERSPILTSASFPREMMAGAGPAGRPVEGPADPSQTLAEAQRAGLDRVRRHYLDAQLRAHAGRVARTARAAGISPRQLAKLMRRLDLRKEDYKARP